MYSKQLLNHFSNPRNVGQLPSPAVTVRVENPACGDVMSLSVLFEADKVASVAYKVRGCTASIAAGSALTEIMVGLTREELRLLKNNRIEEALGGLPAASQHAATLCIDAVKSLLMLSR